MWVLLDEVVQSSLGRAPRPTMRANRGCCGSRGRSASPRRRRVILLFPRDAGLMDWRNSRLVPMGRQSAVMCSPGASPRVIQSTGRSCVAARAAL